MTSAKDLNALLRHARIKVLEEMRMVQVELDQLQVVAVPSEWRELNKRNVYLRLCTLDPVSEDKTILNVVVRSGGDIAPFKSDRELRIVVIEGRYVDPVSGKVYMEGDTQIVPADTLHGLRSDHALLNFIWKPPYPEFAL